MTDQKIILTRGLQGSGKTTWAKDIERIDPAAEARRYISNAGKSGALAADVPKVLASLAQAEATLALVEQQRVANLIALGQFRVGVNDLPHLRDLAVRPNGPDSIGPTPDIAAALGLDTSGVTP